MSADPTDLLVGQAIRKRRHDIGMSQADLAAIIGLSFQQLQKYEWGQNRLLVARLIQIAEALEIAPGSLLNGTGTKFDEATDVSNIIASILDPVDRAKVISIVNHIASLLPREESKADHDQPD